MITTLNTFDIRPRSHRPGENPDEYARRLERVRLKRSELREIADIYARVDAERAAVRLGPAERASWSPADILEWQDLTPPERYLDLKGYARATDRINGTHQQSEPLPLAA
jgi:hypothetical protein